MTLLRKATSLLTLLPLACATRAAVAPAPPPAPRAVTLAYAAQAQPLTYLATDSGQVSMEIPSMGPMAISFDLATTAELTIRNAGGQLEALVRLTQLAGQTNNPGSGTVTVDNSLLPREPGRLTLDARGRISTVDLPTLSRTLREVASGATLYRGFTVRLPPGPVTPGATWVDTITINDELGSLSTTLDSEQRSTYVGDTVVDGRTLARIETALLQTVHVMGESSGMGIEQRLTGKGTQHTLWDPARGVLVRRVQEVDAAGVMTVSAMAGVEIPVTQHTRSSARLRDGG